jgi:hypothetical protein
MMFIHSLADFNGTPWAVQMTVVAITVTAQATSSRTDTTRKGVGTSTSPPMTPTPKCRRAFRHGDGFAAGGDTILRLQRIDPSHTREPTEVDIGGTQFGAVFDRQSGEVSIARQISSRTKRSK